MDSSNNQRKVKTNSANRNAASANNSGRHINRSASGQSAASANTYRSNSAAPAGKTGKRRKKKTSGVKKFFIGLACIVGVLVIGLGGAYAWIMHSIAPDGGGPSIPEIINTPSAYKGDVVNILVCGIDYEDGRAYSNDPQSNDGMTDMIMYVNFDVKNKKMNMLQIPRDTYAGENYSTGGTGKINAVALKNDGMASLCELVSNQYGLPIDYYVTIDMQSLKEIVDLFSYVTVYIPEDMAYNGSMLEQGYRNLDGDAVEFFVRNRNYAQGDIKRLDMQRYFYQGLFARIRTATVWDLAKLVPVAMNYVTTDIPGDRLVSIGVSFLQVDSADIMLCKVPTYSAAEYYNGAHAIQVCDVAKTTTLLNEYFRTYGEQINQLAVPTLPTAGSSTDVNIQYMGQLDTEVEQNSDGATP